MPTTTPARPVRLAHLKTLLDDIARAEHVHAYSDCPAGQLDSTAYQLLDRYRELIDTLRPRPVDSDAGDVIGITLAGLDIHVRDDGDRLAVAVNADDVPQHVGAVIESWDGLSWERPLA